jgi:hypothetical protein
MIRNDMFIEDQPRQLSIQIEKDKYLSRLSEVDRKNLIRIEQLFKQAMEEKGRRGALFTVGGSITKQPPRKDIDVLVVLEPSLIGSKSGEHLTPYKRALTDFTLLHDIVKTITKKEPEFKIQKIIEPAIDEEFGSESILKHDGSITVQANLGVPIEFIRSNNQGVSEAIRKMKEPYVVITVIAE